MQEVSLDGAWKVRKESSKESIPAQVPGCIHTDLLASGKIEDPFYRDNEQKLMWIGESDWVYSRDFSLSDGFLDEKSILLRFEGLDTFAQIRLNGKVLGEADNQFRSWEFDVKPLLQRGKNTIEVLFQSPLPVIRKKQREHFLNHNGIGHHRINGGNRIRKAQCNFGWDWGPMTVTCGIWRSVKLLGFSIARITGVSIRQEHRGKGRVDLEVQAELERIKRGGISLRAVLYYEEEEVASSLLDLSGSEAMGKLTVTKARLWWPNTMGEQNLYKLEIELIDAGARLLDKESKTVGLRTLSLRRKEDKKWGESFYFEVNGRSFFAKGANWIPADCFVTRLRGEDYEYLLSSAASANMNMLRVWGGGIYEDDIFYEICDRFGICVWQDFMFACSAYPVFEKDWLSNVKAEAIDNIKRLRHHPSIALWCGNNELEQVEGLVGNNTEIGEMSWSDYKKLFDRELPKILADLDDERPYWPSSPHSPRGDRKDFNNPHWGDAHLWEVWHGMKPFEWYRRSGHRFTSEFGFQSFPEPAVVERFTLPQDRNISSYVMDLHQRSKIGNEAVIAYMLSWFKMPKNHEMSLWLSQILQGMAMKYAVEHWRRGMPRTMGTLYWQLNDCWPAASWSSIDYYGNWKALHYMAKRFFAPILLSAVENKESAQVDIFLSNDFFYSLEGGIEWKVTDTEGEVQDAGMLPAKIGPGKSKRKTRLNCSSYIKNIGERRLLLWLSYSDEKGNSSSNLAFFARPKHLELRPPVFHWEVNTIDERRVELVLESEQASLWTWIDPGTDGYRFSDQFFHLQKGEKKRIEIGLKRKQNLSAVKKKLKIRSLTDTF